MRVRVLLGQDKGAIRDMPTLMARRALKAGSVELVAKDVCQECGGLIVEVPTLKAEPQLFWCQFCAEQRPAPPKAASSPPEEKPRESRRSRRGRAEK